MPRPYDLNDFRLFAYVVEESSLAAAGRRLGVPRSLVSRRLALLEEHLGVRLVQRSTRSLAVSEVGQAFYRHCLGMLEHAQAAADVVEQQAAAPQGLIRVACPASMIQFQLAGMVADFMRAYPKVSVVLESTNRRVDVLREGFDLAIRVRFPPLEDSDLVVRRFCEDDQHLVCAPSLLAEGPLEGVAALAEMASLSWNPEDTSHFWDLVGPEGQALRQYHHPRLMTQDMAALLAAALAGQGVVRLPGVVARPLLKTAQLVEVLPGWVPRSGVVHAVFPTRRGMAPAVRAFLDFMAAAFGRQAG